MTGGNEELPSGFNSFASSDDIVEEEAVKFCGFDNQMEVGKNAVAIIRRYGVLIERQMKVIGGNLANFGREMKAVLMAASRSGKQAP